MTWLCSMLSCFFSLRSYLIKQIVSIVQLFLRSQRVSQTTMTTGVWLTHPLTHSLSRKYYLYTGRLCGQTSCLRRLNSLTVGCVTWLALQTMTAVTPLVLLKVRTNPHRSAIYTYIRQSAGQAIQPENKTRRALIDWKRPKDIPKVKGKRD